MLKHCRTCGRTYIKSRWCPNCYDGSGHRRIARPATSPTPDIWIGGVPHIILRDADTQNGGRLIKILRCDGVAYEPMRWTLLDTALNSA